MNAIISKIIDSTIEKLILVLKVVRMGNNDSLTPFSALPSGIDSRPINGIKAVYMETGNDAEPVLIGYINQNCKAKKGEVRFYSLNSDGDEENYIYLLNGGFIEIGGDADNMVRFSKLEDGYNKLKDDLNAFITKYNAHIHVTTATIGLGPAVGIISPTTSTETPSSASIADAKIDEIKTS